jgi:hypothetical protein
VSLVVNFPLDYPTNVPPTFTFGKGTTLDSNARSEILKTLTHTANEKVRRNRTCLEPCLRQLENMLEQMPLVSGSKPKPKNSYHSFHDMMISRILCCTFYPAKIKKMC